MDRILAQMMVWYGTHRRRTNLRRTPENFGLEYRTVTFPSAGDDQVALSGWIVPAKAPKAVVLVCHGVDSGAQAMLPKAAMLQRRGYTSILFDFRGVGRSGGDYVTLGYRERDDVLGALEFAASCPELRGLPIFAIGESMGGAAVIRAAAADERIRAIVSESTYATLNDALCQRLKPLGPLSKHVARHCQRIGAERYQIDIADVSPERDIATMSPRPLLFIHDQLDIMCPRAETDRLFRAAKPPKERWDVPYAPHTFAYFVAPREYEARVVDFLDRASDLKARAAA
ncbi:MAG TPA: alpha/beta hydrolase [Chthonomonadaceae bacterium]|nr:alpha/beta hydrolase [Chthonomonadaceae bacterium]